MSLKQNVDELNGMITEFKIIEAFDKFYSDDVVMQENNKKPRVGKTASREDLQQHLDEIGEWKGELKGVAYNEETQTAMAEWFFDFSFKDGGKKTQTEVAVQQWKDGKIVSEKFLYPDSVAKYQ